MENLNSVELICPLYNACDKIDQLLAGIFLQKNINLQKITFIITDTGDNVESHLGIDERISYHKISKEEFNHALTREKYMLESTCDIAVVCTDDVIFKDEESIAKLIKPIIDKEAQISFGRQICTNKTVERYSRIKNYPAESYIVSKEDIERLQINAFFFSDSFAAYDLKIFKELNGFDHKALPTNEDMYYARKILLNGYKKAYCGEASVEHSHKFTLKQTYQRYYLFGQFFKEVPEFKDYKSTGSGLSLAKFILKQALKEFNFPVIFGFLPNMIARYLGKKKGEK